MSFKRELKKAEKAIQEESDYLTAAIPSMKHWGFLVRLFPHDMEKQIGSLSDKEKNRIMAEYHRIRAKLLELERIEEFVDTAKRGALRCLEALQYGAFDDAYAAKLALDKSSAPIEG